MTAPIQEPTPGREVSGLGYGARQLFRRPDPFAGGVRIPWVRLKQLNQAQTWTANDDQLVVFDDVCFSTTPDGNDYFSVTDAFVAGDNSLVHGLVDGLYQMTFYADVDSPTNYPDGGFEIRFDGMWWNQHCTFVAGGANPPATTGIPVNTCGQGYSELTFRMEAGGDFDTWDVQLATFADGMVLFASSAPVQGTTYWEVRYLGACDVPLGLADEFECMT